MQTDNQSDTASVDLAIAFFCSVLVLFVFIAFSIVAEEPRTNVDSIAQQDETQELNSSGWKAVRERGDFAFYAGGALTILDMSAVALGLHAPEVAYTGQRGETIFSTSSRYKAVPNASSLQLYIDAEAPPERWVRARLDLTRDFDCPQGLRPQLTVFLLPEDEDLAPLSNLSQACDLRLRYAQAKTPDLLKLVLVLSPRSFTSQSVFR